MRESYRPPTVGLILAGGLARRMGGGDKPLRKLGGRTLLEGVIQRLEPQCEGLVLNANGDPARFAAFGLPVVADDIEDFAGPLAGILAGLDWLVGHRPEIGWMVSVGGDSPFLPNDFVKKLHQAREISGQPLAVASSDGQAHPVNALWPVALREDLRRALREEGLRKIDLWTARHGVATASWDGEAVDPFFNANTPEELAEAERLLAR